MHEVDTHLLLKHGFYKVRHLRVRVLLCNGLQLLQLLEVQLLEGQG